MNTMIGLVAMLASVASSNIQQTPTWSDGYSSAKDTVVSAHKPMAVFFGKGTNNWDKVVKDGSFDPAINQLLANKYVCVYVDVTTYDGYQLAKSFEVAGKGLVISDASGKKQAFNLSGELTKAELKEKLEVYAKAETVKATETVVRSTEVMTAPAAPVILAPAGFYSTGGCPNGQCPNARR